MPITEQNVYHNTVYQIKTLDPVQGGTPVFLTPEEVVSGFANAAIKQLADRTRFLKNRSDRLEYSSFFLGVIIASQPILKVITTRPFTLTRPLSGCYAYCEVAPTNIAYCPINVVNMAEGTSETIGYVEFAKGVRVGKFELNSNSFTTKAGDVIEIKAPESIDPTFTNPVFTLVGSL